MKFQSFDRKNLSNLRDEMNAVLAKYGVEANLDITLGNMRYSDQEVEIKVVAKVKGGKSLSEKHAEQMAQSMGLKMQNDRGERIVGYNSRSYKYPWIFERAGKQYKCDNRLAKQKFAA